MKKTLLIAAAVAMSFVACSKEEIQTVGKGMTLSANVADDNTKATITDNGDKSWKFSWENGDVVSVTSPSPSGTSYDFTYDGTSFKCETAVPKAGTWSAVYPKSYTTEGISFFNQDGTLKSAMEKYLLTGTCPSDGSAKLSMEMTPTFAILKIYNSKSSSKWFTIGNKAKDRFPISYSNGILGYTSSPSDSSNKIGTVEAGKTSYYIVPADDTYYLFYTSPSVSKITVVGVIEKGPKTLEAGHIYNVTF